MTTSRSAVTKIDPETLAILGDEDAFVRSISTARRTVKIEEGQTWTMRCIPAKLGPKGMFFARVAKHWLSNKPITCPKHTGESFGGSKDAYCPTCDISDTYRASANKAESDLGYQVRSGAHWTTYWIVYSKNGIDLPMSEVLLPYEFNMYSSVWDQFRAFYQAGGSRSEKSITDYKVGNDFIVSKTKKGYILDKQDSMPVFALNEPKYIEWIKKIESGCRQPSVKMPTEAEMDAFVIKIQDAAEAFHSVTTPKRTNRVVEDDAAEETDEVEEPVAPRRAAAIAATLDDDQVPGAEVEEGAPAPVRKAVTKQPAPAATAVARKPAKPAPVVEVAEETAAEESEEEAPAPAPAPAPRKAAPAKAAPVKAAPVEEDDDVAAEEDAEEVPAPAPATRKAATAPAASQAKRPAPAPQPATEDEEDPLPSDETEDQAPAAPLVGEGEDNEPAAAPPAVTRRGALGAAIASKIGAVKARGL